MATIKGLTIEIGGNTTSLQKALKQVNEQSKDLKSELRNIDTLLKLDPTNTDLMARKMENLQKQSENTKVQIKDLASAQENLDKEFKNSTISEEKYNEQTAELAKRTKAANGQLEVTDAQLKQVSEQSEKAAKKFDYLGEKSEKMNGIMKKASMVYAGVIAGLGAMAIKAGQSADDINTLAKQTGLSTDEIQKFQYASERIDVDLDTLTGSMAKLTKNMESARTGSKNQADAFKDLGVTITDNNGKLRSNQDVFQEAITALGKMENETQRDALAMKIFGKSAQDLNPLIKGGADDLKKYGEEAEQAGLILSQDALNSANAFADSVDKLKATATGAFAKIGSEIATNLIPMIEPASKAIEGFVSWIINNKDTVITSIAAIGTGLLAFNVVTMIQGVVSAIQAFKLANESATIAQAALNLVMSLNPIGLIVAAVAGLTVGIIALWNTNEGFRNALIGAWNAIKETAVNVWTAICDFFVVKIPNAFQTVIDFVKDNWQSLLLLIVNPIGGAIKLLYDLNPKFKEWVNNLFNSIKNWFSGIYNIGADLVNGLWRGISDFFQPFLAKFKELINLLPGWAKKILGINSPSKVFAEIGEFVMQGFAIGLDNGKGGVYEKLEDVTAGITQKFTDAMKRPELYDALAESKLNLLKSLSTNENEIKQGEIFVKKDAIENQEQAVNATEAAYAKMVETTGEQSDESIKLEAQLNNERAALNNLRKELEALTKAKKEAANVGTEESTPTTGLTYANLLLKGNTAAKYLTDDLGYTAADRTAYAEQFAKANGKSFNFERPVNNYYINTAKSTIGEILEQTRKVAKRESMLGGAF